MKILILLLIIGASSVAALAVGSSIGIDFGAHPPPEGGYSSLPQGPSQMSSLEIAGVLPQTNWNSFTSAASADSLVDATGTPTGAFISWESFSTFATLGGSDAEGDARMMFGGLAAVDGSTTTMTISGLPASFLVTGYDVIVYYDANSSRFDDSIGAYTIGNLTLFGRDAVGSPFSGVYVQGQTTEPPPTSAAWDPSSALTVPAGNFLRFEGLSSDSFTLTATSITGGAPVNGLQIVQVPEPSAATLAIFALASVGGLRRRRR